MPNFTWKDLFANRNRRHFPDVVVPLASSSHAPSPSSPEPDAEKKPDADGGSNTSLERASCQEKGTAAVPTYSTPLTLEELRTQVENEVSASGHDSVYDRMSMMLTSSNTDWPAFPINPTALTLTQSFGF
jgi:hypothetical protein